MRVLRGKGHLPLVFVYILLASSHQSTGLSNIHYDAFASRILTSDSNVNILIRVANEPGPNSRNRNIFLNIELSAMQLWDCSGNMIV